MHCTFFFKKSGIYFLLELVQHFTSRHILAHKHMSTAASAVAQHSPPGLVSGKLVYMKGAAPQFGQNTLPINLAETV